MRPSQVVMDRDTGEHLGVSPNRRYYSPPQGGDMDNKLNPFTLMCQPQKSLFPLASLLGNINSEDRIARRFEVERRRVTYA